MKILFTLPILVFVSFMSQAADSGSIHLKDKDDITQQGDCTDIKFVIGARLQQTVNPYARSLFSTCVAFNKSNDEFLLALKETREPVHIYSILSKKIKGSIGIPAVYPSVRDAQYACNDTRIIVKVDQNRLLDGTDLLIHDSKSLALLHTISMSTYWTAYGAYNDCIAVHAGNEIVVHTKDQANGVSFKHAQVGDVSYSPDGSQVCVNTHGWHTSKMYVYDGEHKTLLAEIAHDDHVKPHYNADGSQLIATNQGRVLVYDVRALDQNPQEILRVEQIEKVRTTLFSPDHAQFAVLTTDALWLYDLPGFVPKKIVLPYKDASHIMDRGCFLEYSADGSQLLLGTKMTLYNSNDGIFVCNPKDDNPQFSYLFFTPAFVRSLHYYTPDNSRLICNYKYEDTDQDNMYVYNINDAKPSKQLLVEDAYRIAYTSDKRHMVITTKDNFLIRPTLANVTFTAAQVALLCKAMRAWQKIEAYSVEEQEEKEIYDSLDPLLQDKRLFTMLPYAWSWLFSQHA